MDLIDQTIINKFGSTVRKQLLTMSIDLLEEKIVQINLAINNNDPIELFHSLHTLKGLSSIGIEKIPNLCQSMINLIDEDKDEEMLTKFELLKNYSSDYINYIKTQIL